MQGTFILALIFGLIAIGSAVTWLAARNTVRNQTATATAAQTQAASSAGGYARQQAYHETFSRQEASSTGAEAVIWWARLVTVCATALAGFLILISSFWIVSTQNIGIVTSFGKPVGHVSNGPQWTFPWESVTEMDEAIQVTDYTGATCMTVRIADQQTACVTVKVRWRVNQTDADALFRNYKGSTAGIENGLLTPELQNTANTVFDGYDPVGLLNSPIPQGKPGNPTVPQLGQEIQNQLSAKIGSEVTIVSLFTPNVAYDDFVQQRLNAVLTQKAQTLVAEQAEQTAVAQAAANQDVAASVSKDPNVLISRCLDIMNELVKEGKTPTVGMCNLGGSGTPVIVGPSNS